MNRPAAPRTSRAAPGPASSGRRAIAASTNSAKAWKKAKLERITLHECRHSFASLMIAAGVNAKALQTFMGHANISITLDRYGHLMPGTEAEAAGLLDAYLKAERERQEDTARSADFLRPRVG